MALEIKLNQKLSQSLVMTPQLQQAIKLLQLGRLEYLEVIEKELLENPVLEDGREEEEPSAKSNQENSKKKEGEGEALLSDVRAGDQSEYHDCLYEESLHSYQAKSRNFDDDRSPLDSVASREAGLGSHLLWQLRASDIPLEDHDIAAIIFGNLDRNGYLRCSLEELAEQTPKPAEKIQEVLQVVQTFDPPGVAAASLAECLLIQLDQQGLSQSLMARIVEKHLGLLEVKKYDQIAKAEGVPVEEIYAAVKHIQSLEPRPGKEFAEDDPIYITPDIYVRKIGDEYLITLNDSGMPRLRVSSQYQELVSNGSQKNEKEYLQDCIRSASWLIKSVHQRQQTIYKVTESIMKFQREFLEKGVAVLKPLVLKDVADDVGMHESTVSRVTTNKYVHTPQGVFELKFFFTSGLKSGSGEVSSESVKERIKALIAAEDPKKPLSDQSLVNELKAEGIDIARRTVAKYREMLGLLSSSRRKKVF